MAKSLMQIAAEQIAKDNGVAPIAGTFDESKGVAGRVAGITAADSPLMQMARTRGAQLAAARGLTNSTLAGEAEQNAVLGAATPIATSDATLYQQQQLANQQAGNAAAAANAQIASNAGLSGLSLDNSNAQQGRTLAQQAEQFGVTSGQQQQQIDMAARNAQVEQAQRQQSIAQQQQQIDAQAEQFAQQLGLTRSDMELKRDSLTQGQQQFLASLEQQRAQLAQQAEQFGKTQGQQIVLANLDAQTRKDLAGVEAGYKTQINADTNIAGAWGTMTQAIQAIQNNPNLDGPAKTASIQNQIEGFRSFTNFWSKATGKDINVGALLNFSVNPETDPGIAGSPAYVSPPGSPRSTVGTPVDWGSSVGLGA